jgi:hypothetical protein
MANTFKPSGADGLALQVTNPARAAGLVEETSDGDATDLADVRVSAFNQLLLVVDRDSVETPAVTDLVNSSTGY